MLARHTTTAMLFLVVAMIALGGIVHSTGSSLACPDWPLCYGEAMPTMQGGVLFEHSHRMLGALIGFATILLSIGLFRTEAPSTQLFAGGMALVLVQLATIGYAVSQQAYAWLGFGAFAFLGFALVLAVLIRNGAKLTALGLVGLELVVLQGILGGLTVMLRLPAMVSTLHLAIAMALLAGLTFIFFRLRASGRGAPLVANRRFLAIAAVALYAQIVVGAVMRHTGSTLACGTEVLGCSGKLAGATHLALLHRWFAFAVAALLIASTIPVMRAARAAGRSGLRRLALGVHLGVSLQIVLGFVVLVQYVPASLATVHQVVAALLLVNQAALFFAAGPLGDCAESGTANLGTVASTAGAH